MSGFTAFYWRDEPILDIGKWAAERGEAMVRVRHSWTEMNPWAGTITRHSEIVSMPESFARTMRMGGARDDHYEIVQ